MPLRPYLTLLGMDMPFWVIWVPTWPKGPNRGYTPKSPGFGPFRPLQHHIGWVWGFRPFTARICPFWAHLACMGPKWPLRPGYAIFDPFGHIWGIWVIWGPILTKRGEKGDTPQIHPNHPDSALFSPCSTI